MESPLKAFISSTAIDLAAYRSVAKDVVLSLGWHPILINEHLLIPSGPTLQKCAEMVWNAGVFVLLVGYLCGFIPSALVGGNGQISITQFEMAVWEAGMHAQRKQPPVIFMSVHPSLQPGDGEGPVAAASQLLFRNRLAGSLFKHDFDYWPDGDSRQTSALQHFSANLKTQLATIKSERAEAKVAQAQARIKAQEASRQQLEYANRVLMQQAKEANSNVFVGGLIGVFLAALMSAKK